MEDRKKFAIENAGKRFRFGRRTVTVVGYRDNGISSTGGDYVLVSHKRIGWDWNPEHGDVPIVLTCKTKDKKFWYVFPDELKPL